MLNHETPTIKFLGQRFIHTRGLPMSVQTSNVVIGSRLDAGPLPRRIPGTALLAALEDMRAVDAIRVVRQFGRPLTAFNLMDPAEFGFQVSVSN